MKILVNAISSLLILCCLFACGGSGGNGSNAPLSVDLTGFTQTPLAGGGISAVKKGSDGLILEQGIIVNGKKNGSWITYYPTKEDRIKTIANYVDNELNGLFLTMSDRGQIETKTNYVNGAYDGVYSKYKYGNLEETATYANGKMTGLFKQYYRNNKIKLEAEYKDGQQHGSYRYYDEEGNTVMQYEYENGTKLSGGMTK